MGGRSSSNVVIQMNRIIYLILLILSFTGLSVYAYDYTEDHRNSVIDCYTEECDPYSVYQDPYSVYQDPYSEKYIPDCRLTGSC